MIRDWSTHSSQEIADCRVFRVSEYERVAPHTGAHHSVFVIHAPDWVNVIPVTADGEVVMLRQFRHGVEHVTLEIPGGMIDPEDDDPVAAARRELREETGFDSEHCTLIGVVHPNPAIQDNRCHTVLALGARRVEQAQPDAGEDLLTELVQLDDLHGLVSDGSITHALVVTAIQHLDRFCNQHGDAALRTR